MRRRDLRNPFLIPGPNLGRNIVDNFRIGRMLRNLLCKPKIEPRIIDQEKNIRLPSEHLGKGSIKTLLKPTIAPENLPNPDHRGIVDPILKRFTRQSAHRGASETPEFHSAPLFLKGLHQLRTMGIPTHFACNHVNRFAHRRADPTSEDYKSKQQITAQGLASGRSNR